jgi:hypothetical protein
MGSPLTLFDKAVFDVDCFDGDFQTPSITLRSDNIIPQVFLDSTIPVDAVTIDSTILRPAIILDSTIAVDAV